MLGTYSLALCMQSTIDMLNFWQDSKEAKEKGTTLIHPYNLGLKRNFQVITAQIACTV